MRRILTFAVCLCAFGGLAAPASAANPNDFQVFTLPNPNPGAALLPGRLYVPLEAQNGPRPLIVFLHGSGESGTNNTLQVNLNIDNLFTEAKARGAFLYAPQVSIANGGWNIATITDRVMTMVDQAISSFSIDPRRVYLTGLSMGGGGVWSMMSRYDDRFAAGVPISGIAPASDFAPANLLDESIWAFHARNDGTVSAGTSRLRVNGLLTAAGEPLPTYLALATQTDFQLDAATVDFHYTEYWTGNHGIWPRVYNGATDAAMYNWMFSHALPIPEPTTLGLAAIFACPLLRRRSE